MRNRILLSSITVLAVAGEAASAQSLPPTVKALTPATLVATTTFSAYTAFGTLAGAPINLSFVAVNFGPNARLDGTVMFKQYQKSVAYLSAPISLPNGNYSVELAISRVNSPAVVTIGHVAAAAMASCALVTSFNTTQTCRSGTFAITDGKLDLALAVPTGDEVSLAKITISQWK